MRQYVAGLVVWAVEVGAATPQAERASLHVFLVRGFSLQMPDIMTHMLSAGFCTLMQGENVECSAKNVC